MRRGDNRGRSFWVPTWKIRFSPLCNIHGFYSQHRGADEQIKAQRNHSTEASEQACLKLGKSPFNNSICVCNCTFLWYSSLIVFKLSPCSPAFMGWGWNPILFRPCGAFSFDRDDRHIVGAQHIYSMIDDECTQTRVKRAEERMKYVLRTATTVGGRESEP